MNEPTPRHPDLDEIVREFLGAYGSGGLSPLSGRWAVSPAQGYEVQARSVAARARRLGSGVGGYKVSCTSEELQRLIGSDEPVYGRLLALEIIASPATMPLSELLHPLIEVEVMYVVRDDLSMSAGVEEVRANCAVVAGIEVPDSRYERYAPGSGADLSHADVAADNAVAGRVVLGGEAHAASEIDVPALRVELRHDGEVVAQGVGSNVLGDPARAVAWLAAALARRGVALRRGDVVSSGTFVDPLPLEVGRYLADFGPLGQAELVIEGSGSGGSPSMPV